MWKGEGSFVFSVVCFFWVVFVLILELEVLCMLGVLGGLGVVGGVWLWGGDGRVGFL